MGATMDMVSSSTYQVDAKMQSDGTAATTLACLLHDAGSTLVSCRLRSSVQTSYHLPALGRLLNAGRWYSFLACSF